jgi:predicted DNA-binding protein
MTAAERREKNRLRSEPWRRATCLGLRRIYFMARKGIPAVKSSNVTVSIRLPERTKQALDRAAANEMRTISGYLQFKIDALLRREGFLAADTKQRWAAS